MKKYYVFVRNIEEVQSVSPKVTKLIFKSGQVTTVRVNIHNIQFR